MPLLLANALLGDGRHVDVVIDDGVIVSIEAHGVHAAPDLPVGSQIDQRIELEGDLLLPAAVETHAHLDKAFLSEVVPNPTGDLEGAIASMIAHRHLIGMDDTIERAERAARLMATNGYVAVRTHADTNIGSGLVSIEALTEVRRRVADVIDVEIVALAGAPVVGPAGADQRALLRDAVAAGADLVGGCPYRDDDIAAATDVLLEIAADHGVGVDFHTDETLDPSANGLELLAQRTLAGFDLPVTASHCVSLGQQPVDRQRRTAELVAEAGIGVITLPSTNLYLQGRGHSPMPRALTALESLQHAGALVAAGADNLQDPFNPLGRACPFETAALMITAAHLLPGDAWRTVSTNAARVLGRGDVDVQVGARADLLALPAANIRAAIASAPTPRRVWRTPTPPPNA